MSPKDSTLPRLLRTETSPTGQELARPDPEIVFHHQPKTAGSSLRQMLASYFPAEQVCPAEIDDEVKSLTPEQRRQYRFYAGHYQFDTVNDHFQDALWLTFLRNPIDRLVSNFYNLRDSSRHPEQWKKRANERPEVGAFLDEVSKMELKDFVFFDHPRARDRIVNRQTRYLVRRDEWGHTMPDWDEALFERAKHNLENLFSFVGVQESYTKSLQLLFMTFGLTPPLHVDLFTTNVNRAEKTDRGYDIPTHVFDELERHNQMDLALWRYAQELVRRRHDTLGRHMPTTTRWRIEAATSKNLRGVAQSLAPGLDMLGRVKHYVTG